MSIDLKTIKHISKLARISVDEKRAEKLAGDLNSIRNVQLEFLPSIQKQWYVHDAEHNKLGGAYQLLSTGKLHQLHPEHPDSFASSPIYFSKSFLFTIVLAGK